MKSRAKLKYTIIVPGRAYAHRAHHAAKHKENIRQLASQGITEPLLGKIYLKLEYLFRDNKNRLDSDNLLKNVCDALKGIAYIDDNQIYRHQVTLHDMNSSFIIRGIPLTEMVADCFSNEEAFMIIRLSEMNDK